MVILGIQTAVAIVTHQAMSSALISAPWTAHFNSFCICYHYSDLFVVGLFATPKLAERSRVAAVFRAKREEAFNGNGCHLVDISGCCSVTGRSPGWLW